ncbi:MAG: hypothetical protein ACPGU5_05435 [Lishizhenia sp.]
MQVVFTYNGTDRKVQHEIETRVGKAFTFFEKIKMGGNGSPKLYVENCSDAVLPYFKKSSDRKLVNIELRPKGILLYLKNESNDFIAVFPYSNLIVQKQELSCRLCFNEYTFVFENRRTKAHTKFWNNLDALALKN